MKLTLLQGTSRKRLLIFFNGFAMDSRVCPAVPACDILEIHDYTDCSNTAEIADLATAYRHVDLVAWSFGVFHAALMMQETKLLPEHARAVNGTVHPVSDTLGIPRTVVEGTLQSWTSERARMKFLLRLTPDAESPVRSAPFPGTECAAELAAVIERATNLDTQEAVCFNEAVLGTRDRIFPIAAQRAAWSNLPGISVTETDAAHFPGTGALFP